MSKDGSQRIYASNAWALSFGLGLGTLIGVTLASGLSFDGPDVGRFVGAMLGSIVTVAGAVSLFFLKESREHRARRQTFAGMLKTTDVYAEEFLITVDVAFDDKLRVCAGAEAFQSRFDRVVRFAKKFEFEDADINESLHWLEKPNSIMGLVKDTEDNRVLVAKDDWIRQLKLLQYAVQRSQSSLGQRELPDLGKLQ